MATDITKRIGIIFCANTNHKQIFKHNLIHPEQHGRVLNAKKLLEPKYKKYVYQAKDYRIFEILKFLEKGGHNTEHMNMIKKKFDDKNSAYSEGLESYQACLNQVRCLMTMCELIEEDKIDYALNVIRPPGHHCCNKKPAGFCLVNTAIISATRLIKKFKKVNIMDIDLHHGGGTQKMMERNKKIMYTSIHNKNVWSDGLYKRGICGKMDRIINVALPGLSTDNDYIYVSNYLINEMKKFTRNMLVLSAGFDAHKDEMGVGDKRNQRMSLTNDYYGQLGNLLQNNFDKVFVVLEGGYNENVIAESLDLMIQGLEGREIFELNVKKINSRTIKIIENMDKK
jgi:acetoin utilization deacetylase AcuC-like enzyme